RSILGMFVEPIRRDLAISDLQISLLQGLSFALCYSLAGIPLARLADRHNRIRLIACGILVWSLMTAACGMAESFTELFVARMGVGIGEAVLIPATISLLPDIFPRRYLGRANAVFTVGAGLGTGLALVLGGALLGIIAPFDLTSLGPRLDQPWRVIFLIVALPGIVIAALLLLTVPEPARTGSTPIAAGMNWRALSAFGREHRRCLLTLTAGFLLASMAFSGWLAWMPTFIHRAYGMPLREIGPQLGVIVLVFGLSGNVAGGFLVDYLFARGLLDAPLRLAIGGSVLMAAFAVLATLMPDAGAALRMIAPFFFLGTLLVVLPPVSFQMIAPAPIRSQVYAIYQCIIVCVSLGSGPTLVALLNGALESGQGDLRLALRTSTVCLTLASALVLMAGAGAYRRSLSMAMAGASR
ncbi:MAG: MFS transporter, partial [Gammaproteobacteria bacterium]